MPENTPSRRPRTPRPVSQEENFNQHLQPQALDIEAAVLGCIMVEHDALAQVSEILKPESFYDPRHRMVFEAALDLMMHDNPVDMLTVTEELRKRGELEAVGGPYALAHLSSMVTGSANVEYYAGIIAQKHMARQLITFSSEIQTSAFSETVDVDELMQKAEADLYELSSNNRRQDYTSINPVLDDAFKMINDAARRSDGINGIPSGFKELDKITSGWQKSDLIIIGARPAMGKTAFALSMAKNIAIDRGIPVAMFSLEMSNVQLINRIICNVCQIESESLRTGQLKPFEWNILDKKRSFMHDKPLYLDDTAGISIFELRTKARRMVKENGVQLIIIDYLQLMTAGGARYGNRQEEISVISRNLKGLAKELNIPIIALSQVNRKLEERQGDEKRPQLSDLRESGSIEQDADIVCFTHRPEYYHIYQNGNGEDMHGKAEIIVAKHRNGGTGVKILSFKGQYTRFQDIDDDVYISKDDYSSAEINVDAGENPVGIAPDDPLDAPEFINDGMDMDVPY